MSSRRTPWVVAVVAAALGAGGMWGWINWINGTAETPPVPTVTVTVTASAPPAGPSPTVEATSAGAIPPELSGMWCTRSGNSARGGGTATSPCFSFAELRAQYPELTVETDDSTGDPGLPAGVQQVSACLVQDDGDAGCTMAESMLLEYLPAGVGWDCSAYVDHHPEWPGCDPDFTDAHDTTQARLRIVPNHQHNETFIDSEPMYRQP